MTFTEIKASKLYRGVGIALTGLLVASVALAASPHVATIEINQLSDDFGHTYTPPFPVFDCQSNPLYGPVTLSGTGSVIFPVGQVSQYKVDIDWGDGAITTIPNGSLNIVPLNDGDDSFTYSYSGTHQYTTPTSHNITVYVYHQGNTGADTPDDVTILTVGCVQVDPPASITVTKVVNGGTLNVGDFPLFVGATAVTSGAANDFAASTTGTLYTISETNQAGYTGTISGDCAANGNLTAFSGESYSCTITNDFVEPSILTIIKNIINDDFGAITDPSDFSYTLNGGASTAFEADGTTVLNLAQGTYSVAEILNLAYGVTYSNNLNANANCDSLDLTTEGSSATCTITNNDIDGVSITVTKVVLNNSGTGNSVISDFNLFVDAESVVSGIAEEFPSDTYQISETGPEGYTATFTGDCNSDGSLDAIVPGQSYNCTITNDDIPLNMGSIVVVKEVTASSSSDVAFNFDGSWADFSLTGGDSTTTLLSIFGEYSVSETVVPGWEQISASCVSNMEGNEQTPGNIVLEDGEVVTCTFVNEELPQCSNGLDDDQDEATDYPNDPGCDSPEDDSEDALGSITITKDIDGDPVEVWMFNFNGDLGEFSLADSATSTTFDGLEAGSYTINELAKANWSVTNVSCDTEFAHDPGEGDIEVFLGEGDDVTCVYENTYDAPPGDTNPSCSISTNDASVGSGDEVTITWNSSDAISAQLNGNSVDLDGSQEFEINDDTTFTLTVWDSDEDSANCSVDVNESNGGGGGSSRRSGGSSSSDGEVLGEQVSVLPAGAPNTGFGGAKMCLF